jgi:hypothetical protein
MPRIHKPSNGVRYHTFSLEDLMHFDFDAFREANNREARAKDISGSYQPLAQGKPAGGRSKGQPAKGRKPPRKVADKG